MFLALLLMNRNEIFGEPLRFSVNNLLKEFALPFCNFVKESTYVNTKGFKLVAMLVIRGIEKHA